jgi:hypothetical protein
MEWLFWEVGAEVGKMTPSTVDPLDQKDKLVLYSVLAMVKLKIWQRKDDILNIL